MSDNAQHEATVNANLKEIPTRFVEDCIGNPLKIGVSCKSAINRIMEIVKESMNITGSINHFQHGDNTSIMLNLKGSPEEIRKATAFIKNLEQFGGRAIADPRREMTHLLTGQYRTPELYEPTKKIG